MPLHWDSWGFLNIVSAGLTHFSPSVSRSSWPLAPANVLQTKVNFRRGILPCRPGCDTATALSCDLLLARHSAKPNWNRAAVAIPNLKSKSQQGGILSHICAHIKSFSFPFVAFLSSPRPSPTPAGLFRPPEDEAADAAAGAVSAGGALARRPPPLLLRGAGSPGRRAGEGRSLPLPGAARWGCPWGEGLLMGASGSWWRCEWDTLCFVAFLSGARSGAPL